MEWRNIQKSKERYERILNNAKSVIVFDTETTGLGNSAKIIQFSAIRYLITNEGLREEAMMDLFINPEEPLSEKIIELTGITDRILRYANPEKQEVEGIFKFLESADLWAAYNCTFDMRMLFQMSKRTGYPYHEHCCIDVLEMARDLVKKEDTGNHKLSTVYHFLFPGSDVQFHSAIEDVKATAKLMSKFIGIYQNWTDDSTSKHQCHLNWASFWINPKCKSQKRIKLNLSEGDYGDIYWDAVRLMWSCKATKEAKSLFESIDIGNLEKQVLGRYGYRYNANDMQTLCKKWEKDKRTK